MSQKPSPSPWGSIKLLEQLTEVRKTLCFLNHQMIRKGYKSGTARWRRSIGQGTGKGASPHLPLPHARPPHRNTPLYLYLPVFTNLTFSKLHPFQCSIKKEKNRKIKVQPYLVGSLVSSLHPWVLSKSRLISKLRCGWKWFVGNIQRHLYCSYHLGALCQKLGWRTYIYIFTIQHNIAHIYTPMHT